MVDHEGQFKNTPKKGVRQYRFGHYIIGANGNKKGKWTWGQYCPTIPLDDFDKLIKLAKKEKTIIKSNDR